MLKLSLSMTWRDWRAGELRFLILALMLAVAAMSAVQFFSARMGDALQRDAHQLLGADLRVAGDAPIDRAWRREAELLGLMTADVIELQSMASAGTGDAVLARMVSVKAVEQGYPLRGDLRLSSGAAPVRTRAIPAPGTAWIDPALLASLQIRIGDAIELGDVRLVVTHTIASEPDRGPLAMMFAPRVMIALPDLQASGLAQGRSLASWDLLVAGERDALSRFEAWGKGRLAAGANRGIKLETLATSNATVMQTLSRASTFLALVGILTAMLASVAVAMAARRFMLRHADAVAMLRCLGMRHSRVVGLFVIELALVGLAASAAGVALGFGGHFVLVDSLGSLVRADLAPVSALPAWRGMAVGILLLAGFALPPLLQMRDIPHNHLLRREPVAPAPRTLATAGIGLLVLAVLMVWQAGDAMVGLLTVAAFLGAMLVFSLAARAALAALRFLPAGAGRGVLRLALADMQRRPGAVVTQIVALALGLMALLMMTVVRGDLLAAWANDAPAKAPNHVLFNAQPDQTAALGARLRPLGNPGLHPLMLARLVAVNGKTLTPGEARNDRARRLLEREIDVSSAAALPEGNAIVAGRWFGAAGTAQLSVSEISAAALGLRLGDRVRLDFAGTPREFAVTSLRKVDWRSRRSNFGFLIDPASTEGIAATYVTAFYLPPTDTTFVNQLVRDYPNVTVLDTGAMAARLQDMLEQVSRAVEFLFLFTLAAGILVLSATLASTRDERQRQNAILRALGASRAQLARAQWIEYAMSGALAGLLAAAGASAGSWAIARFALDLAWQFSPLLWVAGVAAGAACALAGAWAGLRAVLAASPLQAMRSQ